MRLLLLFALATSLALPARAAINPAEFTRNVPDQMRVRETSRIVQVLDINGDRVRRVTLVGDVVEQRNASQPRIGQSVVIDYTVNLSEVERRARAFSETRGTMPGPQFMSDPEPPTPDAEGMFWANVAPAGGRWGNVNREAGAVADIDGYQAGGAVYVPVSGQYSFDTPY